MNTGSSQYFFRLRRKRQSSAKIEITCTSELVTHALRLRSGWSPVDPIGGGIAVETQAQKILANEASDNADRCDHDVEQYEQHDWTDYRMEHQTEPHPHAIQWPQPIRSEYGSSHEGQCRCQTHWPKSVAPPYPRRREKEENDSEGKAKSAFRRALHLVVAR
jgi:hypothetical protein